MLVGIGLTSLTVLLAQRSARKERRETSKQLCRVEITTVDKKTGRRMMYVHWSTGEIDLYLRDKGPNYPVDSPFEWHGPDGHELDYQEAKRFIYEWKRAQAEQKFEETVDKIVNSKAN